MITEIGIAAGEIWKLLDEKGEQQSSELMNKLSCGEDLALMALGWLCREGHVVFQERENELYVRLRDRSPAKVKSSH